MSRIRHRGRRGGGALRLTSRRPLRGPRGGRRSTDENLGCRLTCYDSHLCSGGRNTSASCLSRLADIPPSLLASNDLGWPGFAGASADLLCHQMC